MAGTWIGVDVGGTKVLAGAVDAEGHLGATARRRTPAVGATAEELEDALDDAVRAVAGDEPVAGVGIAAAGFVDAAGERVRFAPHLPWRGEPVRELFAARWGVPVVLDNDANAAALAEHRYGAGRGASGLLMITIGTGIGGAWLVSGRVHRGRNGMAGEFGHAQVVPDGRACECGQRGCWEQYASGHALVRAARERMGHAPSLLEDACGGAHDRLTGDMIAAAADDGDLVAREAFAEVGEWLGVGLAGLVAGFDPDVVVVGGGAAASGERLLRPAREALAQRLVGAGHRELPEVVTAALGPEAGAIGAATLAREACG